MTKVPSNSVVRELPVIRVFVSSTFSDLVAERNALAEHVWPELERYCRQRGFTFQAIDLRWGVPCEAGLDHRTMQICLEELRRAQETSPEPNFLILLGNKYGWRPLPEVISEAEYNVLSGHTRSRSEQDTLSDWYRCDTNARPTRYMLRSRTDSPDGLDYTRAFDDDGRLRDTRAWLTVQQTLWAIVNRAYPVSLLTDRFSRGIGDGPAGVRFQGSATEQEIWHGALRVENARDHVVAAFREIDRAGGDPPTSELKRFVDLRSDQSQDDEAENALAQLKAEVKQKISPESIIRGECRWELSSGGDFTGAVTTDHLAPMCGAILTRLRRIILRQINDYWDADMSAEDATVACMRGTQQEIELERREHARFARERGPVDLCVGRDEQVRAIREYLQSTTNRPLIVHGPSGSGKTALLAYVAQQPFAPGTDSTEVSPIILTRFIGVHPESSTIRGLLTSLCRELRGHFPVTTTETHPKGHEATVPVPLPDTVHKLIEEFYSQLEQATANRPIYVFLDALDQLAATDQAHQVDWLRSRTIRQTEDVPSHARLVASCLSPSAEFPPESAACEPFRRLQSRRLLANDELGALDEPVAQQLVRHWLAEQQRGLTEEQWKLVDAAIHSSSECRQPLYLKVMYELVRGWREFDSPTAPALPTSLSELLRQTLSRLSEPSRHDVLPRIALGYLVSASYGLSEGELLEVLYRDREIQAQLEVARKSFGHDLPPGAQRFPIAPWARLRSDLRVYLSERSAPGTTVLYFYHRQVEQAVRTMFLADEAARTDRLRRLTVYFDGRWDQPDAHALMEFPDLLLALPDYKQLYDRLTNFAFPMRKAEVGLLESIPDDYSRLVEAGQPEFRSHLEVWHDFFQEKRHILRRGQQDGSSHRILLQLALEHADDSPLTRAAEVWLAEDRCGWMRLQRANRPAHSTRDPCRAVFEGHTDEVRGALLLEDDRVLSWAHDNSLRVWNTATGACRTILEGHTHEIEGALLLRDSQILSWANDHTLRVWNADTWACHAVLAGHTEPIRGAILLADGWVLSWSWEMTLRVWDCDTWTCHTVLNGHTGPVEGALPLSNDRILSWSSFNWSDASVWDDSKSSGFVSDDSALRVWDVTTGTCRAVLEGHTGPVTGATLLSPSQVLSWSGGDLSEDYTLRVWDVVTETCRAALKGHTESVQGALSLPTGRILSWSLDETLRVWDAATGDCHAVLEGHAEGVHGAVLLAGGLILSWSGDMTLRVWDSVSGACQAVLEGHTRHVSGALSLPDGRILSWSLDKTLRVWDAATGACHAVLEGHAEPIRGALLLTDGRVLSWSDDRTLRVWEVANLAFREVLDGHTWWMDARLLPDGRVLSWSPDKTLRVWDPDTGACCAVLRGHAGYVRGTLLLPDDRILSWAYYDASESDPAMRIWDAATGGCVALLEGHTRKVNGALLLPAGRILSWSDDHTLAIWDAETATCHAVLEGHTGEVNGAQLLSADRILSWSKDKALRVWDAATGACHAVLEGHAEPIRGALLLTDGRVLSLSSSDPTGQLRVWDAATGACRAVLKGHTGYVRSMLLLSDDRILSWAEDKTLRVWDIGAGACCAVLEGHTGPVTGALLLADSRILSWSFDNTLRLWDAATDTCLEVVADQDVAARHPDWLHVRAAAEEPARVADELWGAAVDRTASLLHRVRAVPLASWQAESNGRCHCLLPGGTLVVGQKNGQVCFLKLYYGQQRITLAEAEQLLPAVNANGGCTIL